MLSNFSYVKPDSLAEAIRQLGTAGSAGPRRWNRPARLPSRPRLRGEPRGEPLRDSPRSAGSRRRREAASGLGRSRRSPRWRRATAVKERYGGAGPGSRCGGQPAAAQPGDHRRQPLPAPALLVLPRGVPLRTQGRATPATRCRVRTSTTASSARGACVIVHPSDTAPALVALGARVRIAGPGGAPASSRSGSSSCCRTRTSRRENGARARGDRHRDRSFRRRSAGQRSLYRKVRGRGVVGFRAGEPRRGPDDEGRPGVGPAGARRRRADPVARRVGREGS